MKTVPEWLALFTDFGSAGPYQGQLEMAVLAQAPDARIIDLVSNAPLANPKSSAYLLAALARAFNKPTVFLAVVDPGVGSERLPVVLQAGEHFFVGPDNGLLNTVAAQAHVCRWWQIVWRPENCSMSFHGRDIFAPIAAKLLNDNISDQCLAIAAPDSLAEWPADLPEIIYFDHYGNALTGLRFQASMADQILSINGQSIVSAQSFYQVPTGSAFWYRNSSGLVEIAVNQGRAQQQLALQIGMAVSFGEG